MAKKASLVLLVKLKSEIAVLENDPDSLRTLKRARAVYSYLNDEGPLRKIAESKNLKSNANALNRWVNKWLNDNLWGFCIFES